MEVTERRGDLDGLGLRALFLPPAIKEDVLGGGASRRFDVGFQSTPFNQLYYIDIVIGQCSEMGFFFHGRRHESCAHRAQSRLMILRYAVFSAVIDEL